MVAEQRETVQRIDADTYDIASNVSGAQRELLKYYTSISSNRWLMLKVFGVLIVFVSMICIFFVLLGGTNTSLVSFYYLFWYLRWLGNVIISLCGISNLWMHAERTDSENIAD